MSQIFHLFQMYVAFECFMLQVKTANIIGVHGGRQGQTSATDMRRRRRPLPAV
jgi:hypothetical protein